MQEPICGWQWYWQHRQEHTQQEIDSLTIEVSNGKSKIIMPNNNEGQEILKSYREVKK